MVRKLSKPSATKSGAGRSLFILVRGFFSSPARLPFRSTVLCPIHFISDLPEAVLPGNAIALYVDDCKSSRIIDSASDQNLFQEDLNNLHQWSSRNFKVFNVKKSKIMRITMKKQPFTSSFFLDNLVLEEVSEFRDLGITTDRHLRWNLHIDKVVPIANRMLGLYCTLVRSNLENCSLIWLKSWRKYRGGQLNLS